MDGGILQQDYCRDLSRTIKHRKRSTVPATPSATVSTETCSNDGSIRSQQTPMPQGLEILAPPQTNDAVELSLPCPDPWWALDVEDFLPDSTPKSLVGLADFGRAVMSDRIEEDVPGTRLTLPPGEGAAETSRVVMQYFDSAFHDVFPYHCLADRSGLRGWLLASTSQHRGLRNAIFATVHVSADGSSCGSIESATSASTSSSPAWRAAYHEAIADVDIGGNSLDLTPIITPGVNGIEQDDHELQTLACVLHLIWIQKVVFSGNQVEQLLLAAMRVITMLNKTYDLLSVSSVGRAAEPSEVDRSNASNSKDRHVFALFVEMIALDAAQWLSIPADPFTSGDRFCGLMLDECDISTPSSSGSSGRIVLYMLAITRLQQQKQMCLARKTLNVLQLARDALKIDEDLVQYLQSVNSTAKVRQYSSTPAECRRNSGGGRPCCTHGSLRASNLRSLILACRISLHLLVSGRDHANAEMATLVDSCRDDLQHIARHLASGLHTSTVWQRVVVDIAGSNDVSFREETLCGNSDQSCAKLASLWRAALCYGCPEV